jgi:hypothetical protein
MMSEILFFFLHRRSHHRADMTGYLLFYMVNSASHERLRCARAGMTYGSPALFRSCKARSLLTGCRGLWESKEEVDL